MIMIIIIIATMLTGRFATTFTANWQNCYRKICNICNKNSNIFSNNKSSSCKNNNGNVVATDKTNDSNITFRSKKSKKYTKIDGNNKNNDNNNSNSNNNENNSNNKSCTDN